MSKVSLYVRYRGSRKYEKATMRGKYKGNYPEGTVFCLRYLRPTVDPATGKGGHKRCFESLPGVDTVLAGNEKRLLKEVELYRMKLGEVPMPVHKPAPAPLSVVDPVVAGGPMLLDAAIDQYKASLIKRKKAKRTVHGYGHTLREFFKSCGNKPVSSITVQDLEDFQAYMNKEGLSDRTIVNRIGEVVTLLRYFKIKDVTLSVKYVEKKVRAYRADELDTLFAVATPDEWVLFQFFLGLGPREQEVMYAHWSDVDFVDGIYKVTAHPSKFKPKDYEEREIPFPDHLVAALRERQREAKSRLIFPTPSGKPDGHMLRKLKALAQRAGLDPTKFGLHVFRKTFATLLHRAGVDARTIQQRLGHSDLETTLRYLEGENARSQNSRDKANEAFGVFGEQARRELFNS